VPGLEIVFGEASDPGKVRTNNEDALGSFVPRSLQQARSHGYLFAVADGVGGYELGEVASATAIDVVTKEFAEAQDSTMLVSLLPRLVQYANSAVHDLMLTPAGRGKRIATTLVLCALRHNQAVISHVGDSRCYLVREGIASALTQDHTWVNEQRKLGLITAQEMAESESRHILIRSVGPELFIGVDTTTLTVTAGDVIVLCTDGLHGGISEEAIATIVSQNKDIQEIASELVASAVAADGSDNTSAQVIRIRTVEKVGMYRGRPYFLPS
jgi:serine/threonine protein phosphatase PrpC